MVHVRSAAHAVVLAQPEGSFPEQQQPTLFLRPIWSSAAVITLSMLPEYLAALSRVMSVAIPARQVADTSPILLASVPCSALCLSDQSIQVRGWLCGQPPGRI